MADGPSVAYSMGVPRLAQKVGPNLKHQRQRRKISQQELAHSAGLSVSYISMLERGERLPPLDTLEKLAQVLKVNAVELLR